MYGSPLQSSDLLCVYVLMLLLLVLLLFQPLWLYLIISNCRHMLFANITSNNNKHLLQKHYCKKMHCIPLHTQAHIHTHTF